jgi:ankyrin repeat protein
VGVQRDLAQKPISPLNNSSSYGHINVSKILIDAGADVNAKSYGMSPIHNAVKWFHAHQSMAFSKPGIELIKLLFGSGADVNSKDESGKTPLDTAHFRHGGHSKSIGNPIYPELLNYLNEIGAKHSSIQTASLSGSIQSVIEFLETGTDVNEKDIYGRTSLHEAALNGKFDLILILIDRKANINSLDNNGKTPLDRAIYMSQEETISLLRRNGGKTGKEVALMPRLITSTMPFGFTFNTVEGKTYIIESGINVDKWNKLREIKGTGSEVKFIDMRRIYFQKHFYRVVVED